MICLTDGTTLTPPHPHYSSVMFIQTARCNRGKTGLQWTDCVKEVWRERESEREWEWERKTSVCVRVRGQDKWECDGVKRRHDDWSSATSAIRFLFPLLSYSMQHNLTSCSSLSTSQAEIVKRLSAICAQIIPFLSQEVSVTTSTLSHT